VINEAVETVGIVSLRPNNFSTSVSFKCAAHVSGQETNLSICEIVNTANDLHLIGLREIRE
jgi:hypothetical protein